MPASCDLRPTTCNRRPATCDQRPTTCDLRPAQHSSPVWYSACGELPFLAEPEGETPAIFFLGADPECVGLVLCLRSVLFSSQKRGRNARRFFFWAFRWAKELETTLRKMKPKGVQYEGILEHFGVHLGSFWIHFEAGGAPGSLWAALGAGVVKKRAKVSKKPVRPRPPRVTIWRHFRPKSPKNIFRRLFCGFLVVFFASRFSERKSVVQRGVKIDKSGQKSVRALCDTCAGMGGLHSALIFSTFLLIFPLPFSRSFSDSRK